MNGSPLCKSCANTDEAYVLVGNVYELRPICVYDHANFPNLHHCPEYAEQESADD